MTPEEYMLIGFLVGFVIGAAGVFGYWWLAIESGKP